MLDSPIVRLASEYTELEYDLFKQLVRMTISLLYYDLSFDKIYHEVLKCWSIKLKIICVFDRDFAVNRIAG